MKLAFSTRDVAANSFLELCNTANEYGFAGFEIFDAEAERAAHGDSILKSLSAAGAKRKLRNRSITVPALTYPLPLDADMQGVLRYVEMAAGASIPYVVVRIEEEPDMAVVEKALRPAIEKAERYDVTILLETAGYLADTRHAISIFNRFATGALGAAWNIRETYFRAGESAEKTIQTLGAYINYVRLGDQKDGVDVLIGDGTEVTEKYFRTAGVPCTAAPDPIRLQSAYGVAMAAAKADHGTADDIHPVYLRLSQAERERLERMKKEGENA